MATTANSSLPPAALQASRAALSAALADQESSATSNAADQSQEEGEIQEVDMQAQAENIRTVFSDPGNFNVKVRTSSRFHRWSVSDRVATGNPPAPSLLCLDFVVRFSVHQRSKSAANPHFRLPSNTTPADAWLSSSTGMDGGH